jgi:predicted metal-binding protein
MTDVDLEKYCARALEGGATQTKQIHPGSVVTAPWVRLKCQSGCRHYDNSYCCPPHTPTPEETRSIIDSYDRAILFRKEAPHMPGRGKSFMKYFALMTELEGELFKDGFYKAFVFLAGPCLLCKECTKLQEAPCNFRDRARPSMEACGIDVYQTVRNNDFFIETLREKTETQNIYCLTLVD